ncbi:YIEGIA domain-containing protein, partial [Bacillus sp. HC-TM]
SDDIWTALSNVGTFPMTPALVPLAKRDLEDGRVGIFVLPQDQDAEKAIGVIGNVPTLESAVHMSSEAPKGRGDKR